MGSCRRSQAWPDHVGAGLGLADDDVNALLFNAVSGRNQDVLKSEAIQTGIRLATRLVVEWMTATWRGPPMSLVDQFLQEGQNIRFNQRFGGVEIKQTGEIVQVTISVVPRETGTHDPVPAPSTLTFHMDQKTAAQLAAKIRDLLLPHS
jgi:hypothetical protein